tara:strand:+ start:8865 stop:9194 length:330 start_codon:yes stop_codon:yes gene_type:complete
MFKLKILEWIRNTEERLKKLKKKIDQQNPQPKKLKQQVINLDDMLSVGSVDDGILKAEILHNKKEVIIRIRGFANEFRAFDWAKLQSVIWQTDQDAKEALEKETKKLLN